MSSDQFTIAFAGGTNLTKAHEVTERMSEDIDIKILRTDQRLTGNPLKRELKAFRMSLCDALLDTGFKFDPEDRSQVEVHREGPEYNEEDERFVRHLYDLCMMESKINIAAVGALAREVANLDAVERAHQAPSFAKDPTGSLKTAIDLLTKHERYASQYIEFMDAMVYGEERPSFEQAHIFVSKLVQQTWGR